MTGMTPKSRGRAILIWTVLFGLSGQLALAAVLEFHRPTWIDPEYGTRLEHLSRQTTADPDRPLVLLLGSSHVGSNFNTDLLPFADADRKPLVFNWSQSGAGPFLELLYLRRALALGIRPRAVVIEILPVMLHNEGRWMDDPSFDRNYLEPRRLRWGDLPALHFCGPSSAWVHGRHWLEHQTFPAYFHRAALLPRLAPALALRDWEPARWETLITATGRNPSPATITREHQRQLINGARDFYLPNLGFREVHPSTDRVVRELLNLCRREQITICALVRTPESSEFRRWYEPETHDLLTRYLTRLAAEYGTSYVDASEWIEDEHFVDGHHLLERGAEQFTRRFWDEVIAPALDPASSDQAATPQSTGFLR